ncbi:PhoX family protein, partial [Vibrio cholerae]
RFGWVVEIDPHNPNSTPLKRTALGRFKHENAALVINNDGHVVVYLGDDERGEHLYKFVSKHRYQAGNDQQNRNLLEEGTLYVAKFDINENELKGSGRWMELSFGKNGLTPENGFKDQAEVLIFARRAATQVGATTMDRPEWVAVHPDKKHVFCTLTNNKNRGKEGQPVGGPNPREKNNYGQIVRWMPAQGDHTSDVFAWDLYLIAGNPTVHKGTLYAGSENISADNMFNSPDGIGFDTAGRLWIQTDGNYSNQGDFAGQGNNQMLCGDPITGEVKRFLTGPIACEITGLTFSPDHKTMFVGVQHPGEEAAPSHFPYGGTSKPRSTIMMITREDGGVIG